MNKITNVNVLANKKKGITGLFIGLLLIALCIVFIISSNKEEEKAKENMKDLNSIIVKDNTKTDQRSYLDVKAIPYKFAVYDNTTDSYYILSDGNYLYVAYMTADYNKLNKESIYDTPIRIEGVTKATTLDIKKLAIEAYNDSVEKEEEKLSLADYDNYFGEVHLDTTVFQTETTGMYSVLAVFTGMFGIIVILTVAIQKFNFKRSLKKYDETTLEMLDDEMNDSEAFYYAKSKLYLTRNYIVNLNGTFNAIKYNDILWMYPFEHRVNGIKVSKAIKVLVNDGKTYMIANMDLTTKKKKEIYEEIWNTILSKNGKIATGYTKENIKHFNGLIKEMKKIKK